MRRVRFIVEAWGRLDDDERAATDAAAVRAGDDAASRVGEELRALFALDPDDQRATPMEIVRSATREPTEVLRAAGIPPIERDEFHERAWPGDDYGLVPDRLADLLEPGVEDEIGPMLLAWGMARAQVHRARAGA